jgi:hypothetical protein
MIITLFPQILSFIFPLGTSVGVFSEGTNYTCTKCTDSQRKKKELFFYLTLIELYGNTSVYLYCTISCCFSVEYNRTKKANRI